mmetsp:Transcript_52307/g.136723  ORF Transcript_52307/g.136723 Transcript_52307/m.136723 type:complete len:95 (+) Transcript_52307:2278-2562(+)
MQPCPQRGDTHGAGFQSLRLDRDLPGHFHENEQVDSLLKPLRFLAAAQLCNHNPLQNVVKGTGGGIAFNGGGNSVMAKRAGGAVLDGHGRIHGG